MVYLRPEEIIGEKDMLALSGKCLFYWDFNRKAEISAFFRLFLYMFFGCFLLGGEVFSCFLGRHFGASFLIHFLTYKKKNNNNNNREAEIRN